MRWLIAKHPDGLSGFKGDLTPTKELLHAAAVAESQGSPTEGTSSKTVDEAVDDLAAETKLADRETNLQIATELVLAKQSECGEIQADADDSNSAKELTCGATVLETKNGPNTAKAPVCETAKAVEELSPNDDSICHEAALKDPETSSVTPATVCGVAMETSECLSPDQELACNVTAPKVISRHDPDNASTCEAIPDVVDELVASEDSVTKEMARETPENLALDSVSNHRFSLETEESISPTSQFIPSAAAFGGPGHCSQDKPVSCQAAPETEGVHQTTETPDHAALCEESSNPMPTNEPVVREETPECPETPDDLSPVRTFTGRGSDGKTSGHLTPTVWTDCEPALDSAAELGPTLELGNWTITVDAEGLSDFSRRKTSANSETPGDITPTKTVVNREIVL